MSPPSQLPIEAFPAWAILNNVDFISAEIRNIEGKGFGLVAKNDIEGADGDASGTAAILRIPRDLVLSADAVEEYAKVDQNFRQLLDAAGRQVGASSETQPGIDDADIRREHQGRYTTLSTNASRPTKEELFGYERIRFNAMDRVPQVPAKIHPRPYHVDRRGKGIIKRHIS